MVNIERHRGHLSGIVNVTPSKSITNRVLIIRALAGDFEIQNRATASDSVILEKALLSNGGTIDVQDAGTAFRFLTSYLSISSSGYFLTGSERMKQRPVGPLVQALKELGADINYAGQKGFPPLEINGRKLSGGEVTIDASVSSQFISSLLLIAPVLSNGLKITLEGDVSSSSYIGLTVGIMREFGINIFTDKNVLYIPSQKYIPRPFTIENDWSSASFWYIMAALSGSSYLTLRSLYRNSLQGDSVIATIMENFGVYTDFSNDDIVIHKNKDKIIPEKFFYDFYSCPDLVIPLAVYCAAAGIVANFTGIKNLRLKESDRIEVLKSELRKAGATVNDKESEIQIIPPSSGLNCITEFNSHDDHRVAMSFAALATLCDVRIDDERVVAKSYPEFWNQMRVAGFSVTSGQQITD